MTMYKILFTTLILSLFNVFTFSQTQKYSTPTVWENYSVTDKKVTFLMPKLPVILTEGDGCRSEATMKYASYSNGVVYVLTITSKIKPYEYCENKKQFDESNFKERVKFLKEGSKQAKIEESPNEIKFISENNIIKLVNDYKNNRWFEFQTFEGNESNLEVRNFLNSLKFEENTSGKPIGNGSPRNLGDENVLVDEVSEKPEIKNNSDKKTVIEVIKTNLKLILKPKPPFTDTARNANTQGVVRLKLTFLANGGIGNISIVSALPFGLTEQAIAAARKIFFIPPKINGQQITVEKMVEYNFSLH